MALRTTFSTALCNSESFPQTPQLPSGIAVCTWQRRSCASNSASSATLATSSLNAAPESAAPPVLRSSPGAPESQNPANQFVQSAGLQFNPVQHIGTLHACTLPRQTQRHVQARQRRPQFVGDVIEQARLRLHQRLQPFRHGVEVARIRPATSFRACPSPGALRVRALKSPAANCRAAARRRTIGLVKYHERK